ncbi:MAG: nucleotidyltransferase family protein [Robiginitomaculum sp.]
MSIAPIRTAMVMAAGLGTRMKPLTDDRCKALVVVGGKTLIDHMLDRLADIGVTRAVVNVHAYAGKLEAHLSARTGLPKIIISDERAALLETGGGVVKALPLLGDEPILICNIDAVWLEFSPALKALITHWDSDKMDELFLLAPREHCLGYPGKGDFDLADNGVISRRSGTLADWVYGGVEIFKPALARGFKPVKFSRNKIWDKGLSRGKIYGLPLSGYWMHVGDPQARRAAQAILKSEGDVHV